MDTWNEPALFDELDVFSDTPMAGNVADALRQHWLLRAKQLSKHTQSANGAPGGRGEVAAGSHLDPLLDLLRVSVSIPAGVTVHWKRGDTGMALPGWFRTAKNWDLVYRRSGKPIAVVELKSLMSSFGNNLNNRVEEAVGCAEDLDRAIREGLISTPVWKGFVFVIADDPDSKKPSRSARADGIDPVFEGVSYVQRASILSQRLQRSNLYNKTWFMSSSREGRVTDLGGTSFGEFISSLSSALDG
jgi:hypothetical protein